MVAALLDRNTGEPIWLHRMDFEQCDDVGFVADINDSGDVAVGGLAFSQSGGMCTWPQGGKSALVKIFGDVDADAVANDVDNCTSEPNPGQFDSDSDGFGNACDADYNNNGSVTSLDFGLFRAAYMTSTGEPGYDSRIDADSDGVIGPADFMAFKSFYLRSPGPSGLACAGAHSLLVM